MSYRSYLFVPADSPSKFAKGEASGADALILDLEDSVAADAKDAARDILAEYLDRPAETARFVRLNALDSGLTELDVAATIRQRPDGFVLPKCNGPDDIAALALLIDQYGGDDQIAIMVIATETVRAVRSLMRQDWSHPRLSALTWGGEDLSADMGAYSNRVQEGGGYASPFLMARDLTLFAALEAQVAPVDAVFTRFKDIDGLTREAGAARALGFTGKMAIHPAQVPVINTAFTPSDADVDWANRVIDAFDSPGAGVARLNGEMLDAPHRKRAKAILAAQRYTQA
jgi:citrate lyase subunit beta/citryl-CoA lyase